MTAISPLSPGTPMVEGCCSFWPGDESRPGQHVYLRRRRQLKRPIFLSFIGLLRNLLSRSAPTYVRGTTCLTISGRSPFISGTAFHATTVKKVCPVLNASTSASPSFSIPLPVRVWKPANPAWAESSGYVRRSSPTAGAGPHVPAYCLRRLPVLLLRFLAYSCPYLLLLLHLVRKLD